MESTYHYRGDKRMRGMSRNNYYEMKSTLFMGLAFVIFMLSALIIELLNINIKEDICHGGICLGWINYIEALCCKRGRKYNKYQVDGMADSESEDEIVDYSMRCCIRFNHIKKLEARR